MFDSFVELQKEHLNIPDMLFGSRSVIPTDHHAEEEAYLIGRDIPLANRIKWYKGTISVPIRNRNYAIMYASMDGVYAYPVYIREYVYDLRLEPQTNVHPSVALFVPGINELFATINSMTGRGNWLDTVVGVPEAIRDLMESYSGLASSPFPSAEGWAYYTEIADGKYRSDFTGLFPLYDNLFAIMVEDTYHMTSDPRQVRKEMFDASCVRFDQYPPFIIELMYGPRNVSDLTKLLVNNHCHVASSWHNSEVERFMKMHPIQMHATNNLYHPQEVVYAHSRIGASEFVYDLSEAAELGQTESLASSNILRGFSQSPDGISRDILFNLALSIDNTLDGGATRMGVGSPMETRLMVGTYSEELYLNTYNEVWYVIDIPTYILASGGGLLNKNSVCDLVI